MESRAFRALRSGQHTGRCERCRRGIKLFVTPEMREFWLERFSSAEIVEMATACWGAPASWGSEWRDGFVFVYPLVAESAA